MRSRIVFRVAQEFSKSDAETKKILPGLLDELRMDNSRTSMIVDSYEGLGSSKEAAESAIEIYKASCTP